MVGFAGGRIPEVAVNHVLMKGYSIVGVHWGHQARVDPSATPRVWAAICEGVANGDVRPLVMREVAFADAPQALADIAARRTWGKVVVRSPDV